MRRWGAKGARQGQTLVEFALGLPLLLIILIGVVEVGRLALAYTVVGNLAREGARYAIMTTGMNQAASGTPSGVDTDPDQPAWWQKCNFGPGTSATYTAA